MKRGNPFLGSQNASDVSEEPIAVGSVLGIRVLIDEDLPPTTVEFRSSTGRRSRFVNVGTGESTT